MYFLPKEVQGYLSYHNIQEEMTTEFLKESEPMSLANAIAVKEYVGLLSNPFGNGTKITFLKVKNI